MRMITFIKQYLIHYTIMNSFIILELLLSLYTTDSSKLKLCNFDIPIIKTNKSCHIERIKNAGKRHQFLLFNSNDINIKFHLYCPICQNEQLDTFEWQYIPHYKRYQIFIKGNKTLYENDLMLNNHYLETIEDNSENNLCIHKKNFQLIGYNNINANQYMGTYVCRNLLDSMHPSNFIWYHLYRIHSYKQNSKVLFQINRTFNQSIQTIKSLQKQINITELYHNTTELMDYSYLNILNITFKLNEENDIEKESGKIKIKQYQRCYIKISLYESEFKQTINSPSNHNHYHHHNNNNNNDDDNNYERIEINKILRLSFEYFIKLYKLKLNGSYELAINKAKYLGFQLYITNNYILLPCEYEFIQHLFIPIINKFSLYSRYIELNYEYQFKQMNLTKLIHLNKLKYEMLNQTKTFIIQSTHHHNKNKDDYHHIPIHNIYLNEYHQSLILKCDNSNKTKKQLNCTNKMNPNAYWILSSSSSSSSSPPSSKNNINYIVNIEESSSPYMTNDCELKFDILHRNHNGTYYCYMKNSTFNMTTQQDKPIIVYHLYIQRVNDHWPLQNNIIIGIIILIIWSFILIMIWILLHDCINYVNQIGLNYHS
ncbi:unnamed protein product [Schistosoma rodhaini]|nr:unnamed protein product [Schistosoma rodhaini]